MGLFALYLFCEQDKPRASAEHRKSVSYFFPERLEYTEQLEQFAQSGALAARKYYAVYALEVLGFEHPHRFYAYLLERTLMLCHRALQREYTYCNVIFVFAHVRNLSSRVFISHAGDCFVVLRTPRNDTATRRPFYQPRVASFSSSLSVESSIPRMGAPRSSLTSATSFASS